MKEEDHERTVPRLIVEAPELLRGLKKALEYIGIPREDCFDDSDFGRAYAAIARVEGRE